VTIIIVFITIAFVAPIIHYFCYIVYYLFAEKKVSQVKQKVAVSTKEKKGRQLPEKKKKPALPCPISEGCARVSIDGWEWRNWSRNATPAERVRVIGPRVQMGYVRNGKVDSKLSPHLLKGPSARTNRAKMRTLLAAIEGTDLLKISQLSVSKKIFVKENLCKEHNRI
jgi:hypothetical protein